MPKAKHTRHEPQQAVQEKVPGMVARPACRERGATTLRHPNDSLYVPSEPDPDDQPYLPDLAAPGPEKTEPVEEDMPDWLRDAPTQPGLPGPPEPETFDVEMSDQLVGDAVKELLSFSSEQAIANVVENVYLQTSVYHDVEDEAWVNLSMRGRTVCLQKPKYVRDDTQESHLILR